MKRNAQTIIFFTVFIDLLGFGILIPVLPTFATKVVHISDFQIGIVVATFSFMQFLFNPVLGRLSDKIGRKPVLLSSLLLTASSYIIFAFTKSFAILLLSRALAGIGGSNIGVAQAYIADVTTPEERSGGMGIIGAAFGLGFVFGPLIGGYISEFGYNFIGFASATFSLLAFAFTFFALPESHKPKRSEITFSWHDFKLIEFKFLVEIKRIPLVGFLMVLFFILVFSVANIYGTFALLGYKVYHFSDKQNGFLFGVMGAVSAVIQLGLLKRLSVKFKERTLLLVGTIFMGVGLALIPYGRGFTDLSFLSAFMTVGTAILQPVVLSLVSKFSPAELQGGILGVNQSVSALARVLGPLWGGWSFEYIGYKYPFLTGAFFTLISFLLVYFILTREKLENTSKVS